MGLEVRGLLPPVPLLLSHQHLSPLCRLPRTGVQVPEPGQEAGLGSPDNGAAKDPPVATCDGGKVARRCWLGTPVFLAS